MVIPETLTRSPLLETNSLGMLMALGGISMLFVALTSSYVVRAGLDPAWRALRMPSVVAVDTFILMISSITMEKARRAVQPRKWLAWTLALGIVFLAGQLFAWRQLAVQGIYLN